MKNSIPYLILSIAFFLSSCEDEASLNTIDELAIEAYLHAGRTMDTIKISKVIPLDIEEVEAIPENLLPQIAEKEGSIFNLYFLDAEGAYGNPELNIKEGKTYSFEVEYNGKIISAETYIPSAPAALTLSDSVVFRNKIIDFTDLLNQGIPDPVEINWTGEEGAFYFVSVKNIEDNPEVINEVFESEEAPDFSAFQTEPSTATTYALNAFQDITHYGWHEVTVFRVNPEYVVLFEDNTSGSGNINQITTNVKNGFGIFTGINSSTVLFEVKKS